MLSAAVPLIALLLTVPPGTKPGKAEGSRVELGQKLFNQGDFDGALKALDAAAAEGGDSATMEKVHLLRAQCWAARQDFNRAEEAFALVLEANPDAALDPARVDPTVVKLLESVRARLTGSLIVNSTPQGATLFLDGKAGGVAPQTLAVPAGKHKLEVRWGDGPMQLLELQVRPRRDVRIEWVQGAAPVTGSHDILTPRPIRPFGDLRGMFEPATSGALGGGLELGGGFEFSFFRIGLFARLYPRFGITPRFQFALPVLENVNVLLEAGLPISFVGEPMLPVGLGFEGGGGAEYYPLKWIAGYLLVGGRHHFLWPYNDRTAFTATAGVRLRVP